MRFRNVHDERQLIFIMFGLENLAFKSPLSMSGCWYSVFVGLAFALTLNPKVCCNIHWDSDLRKGCITDLKCTGDKNQHEPNPVDHTIRHQHSDNQTNMWSTPVLWPQSSSKFDIIRKTTPLIPSPRSPKGSKIETNGKSIKAEHRQLQTYR